jgi:hypothetical protein
MKLEGKSSELILEGTVVIKSAALASGFKVSTTFFALDALLGVYLVA